ncbi:hypothetical protein [Kribbella sp. NPDC004875]|uniref:hypothetical protein n=1 Tax=Kribbella sp. NPDC004875 TaxID=3364107 RepID=UPI00368D7C9E
MSLRYIYQVTKYDPADWNEDGRYVGLEVETSDHGTQEAAYLSALAAFAEESGVGEVSIREPEVAGPWNFGLEAPIDGHGLSGQFAPDLSDYYDGAVVPISVAIDLVRAMLRDNGAWCRLEVEGRFLVHVGFDQYMFIGSHAQCERAVATTTTLGLFPIRLERSPYEPDEVPGPPADAAFWANVADLVAQNGTILLRESAIRNTSRWHRLTPETLDGIQLAPRSRLSVWPNLSPDVQAAQSSAGDVCEYIWANPAGEIQSVTLTDPTAEDFPNDAVAAAVVPFMEKDYKPLLEGVLPDPDGVLRARWSAR